MNNYDRRPIEPLKDAWLLDSTGKVVGVELSRASNQKTYLPSSATEGTIDGTLTVSTHVGNVTGNTSGTTVTTTGAATLGDPIGMFANQITVPAAMQQLNVDANGQSILFGPWTVQSTAGVVVNGEVRVF